MHKPFFHKHRGRPPADAGCEELPSPAERFHLVVATINAIRHQGLRHRQELGKSAMDFLGDHPDLFGSIEYEREDDATTLRQRDALLNRELARIGSALKAPKTTPLDRRIAWLGQLTGLSALDRAIAALLLRRRLWPLWSSMCERVLGQNGKWLSPGAIGSMLGVAAESVRMRLERHSPLILSGLVEDHQDDDFCASDFLERLGRIRSADSDRLAKAMLRPEGASTLDWDDFEHFRAERDLAEGLIAAAARRREGINLLLHGVPGTGKTEFARALADRLGLQAIFAGKSDTAGGEPARSERIAHLAVVRALTRRSRKHLIVIDEAEDLMLVPEGRHRANGSKLWLNHLIEGSVGPTIWIVNDLSALGEPIIRRMSAAIGFPVPPPAARERIMARHAVAAGLDLTETERHRLGKIAVPPAIAAHAVRAASLTDGTMATIQRVATGLSQALGTRLAPPSPEAARFDAALSRADHDLDDLANQLAATSGRAWSMLLEGVSGTGKSAYARHLAERLGLELIERRGSDLLSPFIGETEQNIAGAFAEAAQRSAVLLLDEADALLRDRSNAQRGWEVSMTNEMLTWMERHPGPFVVTTNLADTLDPATMRRFLFRIRFDTLDRARAEMLWERHFGDPPPHALAGISGLVPSDFALSARRIALFGSATAAQRLAMLLAETAARTGPMAPIGFLSAAASTPVAPEAGIRRLDQSRNAA